MAFILQFTFRLVWIKAHNSQDSLLEYFHKLPQTTCVGDSNVNSRNVDLLIWRHARTRKSCQNQITQQIPGLTVGSIRSSGPILEDQEFAISGTFLLQILKTIFRNFFKKFAFTISI